MHKWRDQTYLSANDRQQIEWQVQSDLLDHLYAGCLPGTISGLASTTAIFIDFYGFTQIHWLVSWWLGFNGLLILFSGLYFYYKKHKANFSLFTWDLIYSFMMVCCATMWAVIFVLMPNVLIREYLALIAIFLVASGYATGTIGRFKLCVTTLIIVMLPLIVWCFYKGSTFYHIIAIYSIIYASFLIGANFRSSRWFNESLKLRIENSLVTYQANHDLLTDLPNQRLLLLYLNNAIAKVKNSPQTFLLICFSLNRMELIYDSLGDQAGNFIIRSVAKRLNSLALNNASAAQYTITISRKDVFRIIIAPVDLNTMQQTVENLFSVLEDSFVIDEKVLKVSASIGVSVYGRDGTDLSQLLAHADAAMLQAKQYGGNRIEFYKHEIDSEIIKQLEIEADLHKALEDNQLQVYFQPLVSVDNNEIVGMEALLRWPHPIHGFISPLNFIAIAEETGLILSIGAWVLEVACIETKKWHDMGFDNLKVAVNLSVKQLSQEELVDVVKQILQNAQLEPQFLELEITEMAILDESVIPVIENLVKLGVSLAIDDFGTGYSGLSYLKKFSINKLKIDQSFIKDIPENADSMTIVSAIIAMAKELNIKTLAEGVETETQFEFLRRKKCDFVQGFLFGKPLASEFFTDLLMRSKRTQAKENASNENIN